MQSFENPAKRVAIITTAIEQSNDGIVVTTAEIDPPGPQIVYVNPAFCRITGYAAEDVIGKTPRILQGPKSSRATLDAVRRSLQNAEPFFGEIINYRKDGSEFWMQWHIAPVWDERRNVTHFVAVQRDVTELKRNDEALRRHERLVSIGRLAAGIAHEINNPLASILLSQGIIERCRKDPDAEQEFDEALAEIKTQCLRARDIVKSILTFAREQTSSKWRSQLEHSVRDAVDYTRYLAKDAQVTVRLSVRGSLPEVLINPTGVVQVFVNVISNAIRASKPGSRVSVTLLRRGKHVCATVVDHGIGMSENELKHAFDPFYTADESLGRTGLGLPMALGIIQEHGGTIEIESERSKGTKVKIELPVSAKPKPRKKR